MLIPDAATVHSASLNQLAERQSLSLGGEQNNDHFAELLSRAAAAVNGPQEAAEGVVQQFAKGEEGEIHQAMLTLDKADIAMKFFVSVRNKFLEAYREVMHMGG